MTYREKLSAENENLGWCKPLSFANGKVIAAINEGSVDSIQIEGKTIPATDENIRTAAKIANESYDLYKGWNDTNILLDAESEELPCRLCPWFGICDAMDDATA